MGQRADQRGLALFPDAWTYGEVDDSALGHAMWQPRLALFIGSLLIAIICGFSLSFAMGGTAVVFGYLIYGGSGMYSIVSAAFGGCGRS